jgi:hypothetical protein
MCVEIYFVNDVVDRVSGDQKVDRRRIAVDQFGTVDETA